MVVNTQTATVSKRMSDEGNTDDDCSSVDSAVAEELPEELSIGLSKHRPEHQESQSAPQLEWQRLSPWSILHFLAAGLQHLYGVAFALASANLFVGDANLQLLLLGFTGILLVLLLIACIRFRLFRYQISQDSILIRQGIVVRKQLDLKFNRIQNINIKHPFYFRPIGLVTLKIDGAGSAQEEVYLSALNTAKAEGIRELVRQKSAHKQTAGLDNAESGIRQHQNCGLDYDGSPAGHEMAETFFYSRTNTDLVIHGLTDNRAWLILAGMIALFNYLPYSYTDVIGLIGSRAQVLIGNQSAALLAALFVVSFILAIGLAALLSIMGSILTFYNYRLFRSSKSLMAHCGLLTKNEINMQKTRIQTLHIAQDWLGYLLKRNNLIYEQISLGPQQQNSAVSGKKLLVPAVHCYDNKALIDEGLEVSGAFPAPESLNYTPISRRWFIKQTVIYSVLYLTSAAVFSFSAGAGSFQWNLALGLIPCIAALHIGLIYIRWKKMGITIFDDIIVIRKGLIGIDYFLFPAFKIQAVAHSQSVLMRRRQLSNVVFLLASRSLVMPFLPTEYAQQLIDRAAYCAEASAKSYM